jgi:CYTH domain-containing protein
MNLEIERKFLVKGEFKHLAKKTEKIKQGYISDNPEKTVRVRLKADKAFLTIKGKGNKSGATRFEFEKEISLKDANELFNLCSENIIEKTRYLIPNGKFTFEVDVFEGQNIGLIIAEIELQNEDDFFEKPNWLGEELTGDIRYYNSYLSRNPFTQWGKLPLKTSITANITNAMINYFGKDERRINHALKVFAYAKTIAELENISKGKKQIIEISALLHDIGIQVCEDKYNSVAGHYQEIESPIIAKNILNDFNISENVKNRVLFIIANHHTYSKIDGIDFQILVEADFLVNFAEKNVSMSILPKTKENIFKTGSGLKFLEGIF